MPDYITTCEQLAREAGDILRQWQGRVAVREKARADLVTEADFASQSHIQQRIADQFPSHAFLGEESTHPATQLDKSADFCWIVDPLDGTTNFVHGLPGWCVSIGLAQAGRPIAGCVYDPVSERCYTAGRGEGAFCNGQPLKTSEVQTLENALVAISLPATVDTNSPEIGFFMAMLGKAQAFRRLGSAALNLCYVAGGQLDAYWANSIHAWDVAAGVLFVEEAGGTVTSLTGSPYSLECPTLAVAGSQRLHREVTECLAGADRQNRP